MALLAAADDADVVNVGVVAAAVTDTEEEAIEVAEAAEAVAVAVAVAAAAAEAEAEAAAVAVAEAASDADAAAAAAAAPSLYASTCDHEPGAAHKSTARVTPSKMWHSSSTCSAGHMHTHVSAHITDYTSVRKNKNSCKKQ